MDADALEVWHALHEGKPRLESGRLRDDHWVRAFGDSRLAWYFASLLARLSAVSGIHLFGLQVDAEKVAPSRLQGVAEVILLGELALVHLIVDDSLVAQAFAWEDFSLHHWLAISSLST